MLGATLRTAVERRVFVAIVLLAAALATALTGCSLPYSGCWSRAECPGVDAERLRKALRSDETLDVWRDAPEERRLGPGDPGTESFRCRRSAFATDAVEATVRVQRDPDALEVMIPFPAGASDERVAASVQFRDELLAVLGREFPQVRAWRHEVHPPGRARTKLPELLVLAWLAAAALGTAWAVFRYVRPRYRT
jgi:hypothetical protein